MSVQEEIKVLPYGVCRPLFPLSLFSSFITLDHIYSCLYAALRDFNIVRVQLEPFTLASSYSQVAFRIIVQVELCTVPWKIGGCCDQKNCTAGSEKSSCNR